MEPHVERSETDDAATSGSQATSETTHERREPEPVREYRGTGIMWSGIAVVVLTAVLVLIAFQNTQAVDFQFLWFDTSISLSLILAITTGLAVVATEVVGFVWRHRRRKLRRERDELKRLRNQKADQNR